MNNPLSGTLRYILVFPYRAVPILEDIPGIVSK